MHEVVEQVRRLLGEAERLPLSAAKLAVLEEAVRLADVHQEIALGIEARRPLMWVARALLRGDVLAVAFAWCLVHHDRDPERFAGRDLFVEYREVIGQMANLPDVSRAKLEELLDDFGRRLQAAGQSLYAVYEARVAIAPDLGDRALATVAKEAIRKLGGFHYRTLEIETELFLGNEEQALRLAGPVLMPGASRDRGGADLSHAGLLLPLLKRKCFPAARRLERRLWRAYHPEQCYYWPYGRSNMAGMTPKRHPVLSGEAFIGPGGQPGAYRVRPATRSKSASLLARAVRPRTCRMATVTASLNNSPVCRVTSTARDT